MSSALERSWPIFRRGNESTDAGSNRIIRKANENGQIQSVCSRPPPPPQLRRHFLHFFLFSPFLSCFPLCLQLRLMRSPVLTAPLTDSWICVRGADASCSHPPPRLATVAYGVIRSVVAGSNLAARSLRLDDGASLPSANPWSRPRALHQSTSPDVDHRAFNPKSFSTHFLHLRVWLQFGPFQ